MSKLPPIVRFQLHLGSGVVWQLVIGLVVVLARDASNENPNTFNVVHVLTPIIKDCFSSRLPVPCLLTGHRYESVGRRTPGPQTQLG